MTKRARRMTDLDIKSVVLELDQWAMGQLGSKLRWNILEKNFGFSRQSLQAKPEIKAAFYNAKQALKEGLVKSKEQTLLESQIKDTKIQRLELELKESNQKDKLWKARWQRIAFHIRNKGIQVKDIDKEIPDGINKPTERETAEILKGFDKDIPP